MIRTPNRIGPERSAQALDSPMCDVRLDTEGQKRERLFLLDNRRQLPVDRTQRFQIRPLELPRFGG